VFGGVQVTATCEAPEAVQCSAFARRGGHTTSRWCCAASDGAPTPRASSAGEELEALIEPVDDVFGSERPYPRGSQLDCQGNAVQTAAQDADGGCVVVREREVTADTARTIAKQDDRFDLGQRITRSNIDRQTQ
jgi:hypothetical protein